MSMETEKKHMENMVWVILILYILSRASNGLEASTTMLSLDEWS